MSFISVTCTRHRNYSLCSSRPPWATFTAQFASHFQYAYFIQLVERNRYVHSHVIVKYYLNTNQLSLFIVNEYSALTYLFSLNLYNYFVSQPMVDYLVKQHDLYLQLGACMMLIFYAFKAAFLSENIEALSAIDRVL